MSDNQQQRLLDIHRGWIGYVQPVGLVVAPAVLVRHGIGADSNVAAEQGGLIQHLTSDDSAVADIPAFLRDMLGWQPDDIIPAPGDLDVPLPELGTTLRPTFAVPDPASADGAPPWQMLIGVEPLGTDLDAVIDNARAWAATPQARFERLLRATSIPIGLLTNGAVFRLVYTPRGEASGHATFRLADMRAVTGRPILSAFLTLLRAERMFGDPDSRLTRLLDESRRYQTEVSAKLATQVLEGLYELLRGLHAADLRAGRTLLTDRVRLDTDLDHVYAGLLTVMMRLVFVLYAEDRGMFPDHEVWAANYSLAGLHTQLRDDVALHPDTMDDRYGAWPRLLALFRIVYSGITHGERLKLVARRGGLFDPDRFPFLEGRATVDAPPDPPRVSDGTIWRILQKLMVLDGERLSYRTLDVEQIGSVYETMMGFTVQLTTGQSLAVRSGKRGGAASVINLDTLLATPANKRAEVLATQAENKPSAGMAAALRAADSVATLEAALARSQDRTATPRMVPTGTPVLQPTPARRRSGSHYTPRALTEPIVRTTLKPILARLGDDPAPEAILELKVLDPAMGSGAFLVEACRQLADELVAAWSRRGATPEIPPDEDPVIHARRLVAQRCLYGVDRNRMAVDIALLSLWLATLAKEHEFTFLSHALRAGDSLVGLTVDQIAALNWDASGQAMLASRLVRPKIERAEQERARIRAALDWMGEDELRPLLNRADAELAEVRRIGNAVIGAFFSEANDRARRERRGELADAYDAAGQVWLDRVEALAQVPHGLDPALTPFHWPVEFPEVFDRENPGFDVVIGNPPFLRGKAIGVTFGNSYRDYLMAILPEANASADIVALFFRRSFSMLRANGALGLVATKTISKGDTRQAGLKYICKHGGTIFEARRRLRWPGVANVVVSVIHIINGTFESPKLDGLTVSNITAFLFSHGGNDDPAPLRANDGISFNGCAIAGVGFTFDDDEPRATPVREMHRLIAQNPRNKERIFPYLGDDEINNSPTQAHRRYIVFFGGMSLEESMAWPDLLDIVVRRVKPERDGANRPAHRERWWQFGDWRPGLFSAISSVERMLCVVFVSQNLGFVWIPKDRIVSHNVGVFANDTDHFFCVLQSRVHEAFGSQLSSGLEDRPGYRPSDGFEPFPFPADYVQNQELASLGKRYYDCRSAVMIKSNEGLTATYNRFNDPNEESLDILTLRELHAAMDRAVLDAYGWTDLHPVAIHEREWEAEEGERPAPWRLRWPEADRDEVLARLLDLNRRRKEEEAAADAPPPKPKRKSRAAAVPSTARSLFD